MKTLLILAALSMPTKTTMKASKGITMSFEIVPAGYVQVDRDGMFAHYIIGSRGEEKHGTIMVGSAVAINGAAVAFGNADYAFAGLWR
jgi:hypothetical protein